MERAIGYQSEVRNLSIHPDCRIILAPLLCFALVLFGQKACLTRFSAPGLPVSLIQSSFSSEYIVNAIFAKAWAVAVVIG